MFKIVDLFCGVGGFGLGAKRAQFEISVSIDNDSQTTKTHRKNLPRSPLWEKDVLNIEKGELCRILGVRKGEIDGIIGGPPCQGFSFIGRRDISDPRNQLFVRFFEIVNDVEPRFFLAENVLGILSNQNAELVEHALTKVLKKYEVLSPMRLDASMYGVPTTRERAFFYGYLPDKINPVNPEDFTPFSPQRVYVKDALKGLPLEINPNWIREEDGWRKTEKLLEGWYGSKVYDQIPDGVGDKEAIMRLNNHGEVSGCLGTRHSQEVITRFSEIVPGKVDPVSRCYRLDYKGFCPTIRAGTNKDKGSYQSVRPIHPSEDRVITPREAARLQGYPDWFQFHPTKWHSFRQIGNSVSPILAEHILRVIKQAF